MSKRLRFKTALTCRCGTRGELVWEEDEPSGLAEAPLNYEVVSITGPFLAESYGRAICQHCICGCEEPGPAPDADHRR